MSLSERKLPLESKRHKWSIEQGVGVYNQELTHVYKENESKILFTDVRMGSGVSSAAYKNIDNNTNKFVLIDKEFLDKVLNLCKKWPNTIWPIFLPILLDLITLGEELVLKWNSPETGISQCQTA